MADSGFDTTKFRDWLLNVGKYLYWILGLLLLVAGCFFLYNRMNKQVAAILVFFAGFLALYYYYVKWFVIGGAPLDWPPYKTMCPDFLTMVRTETVNGVEQAVCMDFVGVSANSGLTKATTADIGASTISGKVFTVASKVPDATGALVPNTTAEVCKQAQQKGLTWSGLCPDMEPNANVA